VLLVAQVGETHIPHVYTRTPDSRYWGLWAINQAVLDGTKEFDFVRYADARLSEYYRVKSDYMK